MDELDYTVDRWWEIAETRYPGITKVEFQKIVSEAIAEAPMPPKAGEMWSDEELQIIGTAIGSLIEQKLRRWRIKRVN